MKKSTKKNDKSAAAVRRSPRKTQKPAAIKKSTTTKTTSKTNSKATATAVKPRGRPAKKPQEREVSSAESSSSSSASDQELGTAGPSGVQPLTPKTARGGKPKRSRGDLYKLAKTFIQDEAEVQENSESSHEEDEVDTDTSDSMPVVKPPKKKQRKEVTSSEDAADDETDEEITDPKKKPRKKPVRIPKLDPAKEEEMIDKIKDNRFIWNKQTDGRHIVQKRRAFWDALDEEYYDGQFDMARRFYQQARTKLGKINNFIATAKHSGAGGEDIKLTEDQQQCVEKWGFLEPDIGPIESRNHVNLVQQRLHKLKKKKASRADLLKQAEESENQTIKSIQSSIETLQKQLTNPTPPAAAAGSQRVGDQAEWYGDLLTNEMRRMPGDNMRNFFMYCMEAVNRHQQQQVYQPVPMSAAPSFGPPPTLTPMRPMQHHPLPPTFNQPPAGAFNPYAAPPVTTAATTTTSATGAPTPSPIFQTDGTFDMQQEIDEQQRAIFHI